MTSRRTLLRAASAATALPLLGVHRTVRAQNYPQHPVTIVVAFTPGSANDILVRLIAPEMGTQLGQPVVVFNKPGAGGVIGMSAVATAKPDGYTLGLGSTATIAINKALYKSLPYDPAKDFTPIINLASTPNVLVVPASSPVRSVRDLTQAMGRKVLNYSSPGNGTTQHLAAVKFARNVGKPAEHIVFRGPAEAITGLISNQVDFGFVSLPSSLAQIRDNRLRALGVTPNELVASLPDVASLATQGLSGFDKTDVWFGLVLPNGTPEEVVQSLHRAASAALQNPGVRGQLATAGFEPARPASGQQFASFVHDQVAFWDDLVKTSGASID